MVAHHEPVTGRTNADQPQVERRLVEQIEAGLTLLFVQGLQLGFLLGLGHRAPVEKLDRGAARLVDNLQHVFADVPAKRRAQGFVARHHRLPGQGETLRVQFAVDAVAVLHVIQAGARLQQGVQQHALLHRGQRVDVFDLRRRYRQAIELGLGQARQGEVGRRQATGIVLQAMADQALQLAQVGARQLADQLGVETFAAVGPAQHQLAAIHLAVDAQFVGQRRFRCMGRADGFIQRAQQCIGTETLVELPQVVEGHRRQRQRRQGLAAAFIRQVAQHAVTQALVRHGPQLFLDGLDRGALPGRFFHLQRRQAQRIGAGEPTHGASQVDLVEQRLAAVAFQLHQGRRLPAPATQHPGQGGQQQVVDLGAVGRWSLLQQLTGALGIQGHAVALSLLMLLAASGLEPRQLRGRAGQLLLPPAELFTQGLAAGIGLQAARPVPQGTGLGRQLQGLPGLQLTIGVLQIFQQHAPGHTVHHQVVDGQQQALLAFRAVHQHRPQQRPVFQVEAALGIGEQCLAGGHGRHPHLPEQGSIGQRQVLGAPLPACLPTCLRETQAQGVVLLQHRQQRLLQQRRIQGAQRFQQQGLVPVLRLGNAAVEEPVLDRRQRRFATELALLGADALSVAGDPRQGLHGLVLEQVPRGEVNPQLAGTADHLDRQDRVAPQFEEIVVEAHLLHVQHFAPDPGQGLFQLIARRHVLLAIELRVRQWQGSAIELAVGGQRHAAEQDQVGRHHVVRQLGFQLLLEGFTQVGLLHIVVLGHLGHQVTSQLLAGRGIQGQHHRFTHGRMIQQAGFDFPQLDAETADLHLMVHPADVFHLAVGALAHQVPGAVQAPAICGERIGDKTLGTHPRTTVITLGQTGAADIQLTGRPLGHQRQIGIENVSHPGPDDAADGHAGHAFGQLLRRQAG